MAQHTCFRRLPGSLVPGLEPAYHGDMVLPLMANCVWWIAIRLCVHNCQSVWTVIKILMKENQEPFIIMEEQLLTAFTSGELHRDTSQSTHCLCVLSCNNSEVWLELEVLTFSFLKKLEGKFSPRRLEAGQPSWQVTCPDVFSSSKLLPLFGSARKEDPPPERRNLQSTLSELCYIVLHPQSSLVDFCKMPYQ